MRRIVVTPAGRARYLAILYEHLKRQRDSFDQWLLLMNTASPEDIGFCERLAARNEDWIDTRYAQGSDPSQLNMNIHRFLNQFCRDEDAVYLRLDDDVVYLSPGFVEAMFAFRLDHPRYFLVYGNIINNAVVSWLHQKLGNFEYSAHSGYECTDAVGWKDPEFAEALHREFLRNPQDPKWTAFRAWVASEYERVSVNAVSWFGKDLLEQPVDADEERWLSVERPRQLRRPNVILGQAVCAHYAFHVQREHLDATDLLDAYRALAAPPPADKPADKTIKKVRSGVRVDVS